MAETGIKFKIDGVEVTLKSLKDVEDRVSSLQKKIKETDYGSKEQKQYQKELEATQNALLKAELKQQSFLTSMAKAPGIVGTLGQSLQGIGQSFKILAANPWTAALGILIGVITKIVEKLSSMEAVSDAVGRATAAFGAVIGKITKFAIEPMVDIVVKAIDGIASLASWFASFGGDADDAGDAAIGFADSLDAASDAAKENEIANAAAARSIAEAREVAADATKSTKERVEALKEAAKIEKEVTDKTIKDNTEVLRGKLGLIATEMGARNDLIKTIQKGSIEELKAAKATLSAQKDANKAKLDELNQLIIQLENDQAQSVKIQTKTNKQIAAIENEAAKEAKDRRKTALGDALRDIDAKIKLEQEKEKSSKDVLEKLYKEKGDKQIAIAKMNGKLSIAEEALIRQENTKALETALNEDQKLVYKKTAESLDERNKLIKEAGVKDLQTVTENRDAEYNEIQKSLSKQEITQEEARKRTFNAAKSAADAELNILKKQKDDEIAALKAVEKDLDPEERKKRELAIAEKYDPLITNKNKEVNKLILDDTLTTNKEIADANKKAKDDKMALLEQELNDDATSYARKKQIITEKEQELLKQVGLTEDAKTLIQKNAAKQREAIDQQEFEAKKAITDAMLNVTAQAGQFLQQIAGKNKAVAKAGIIVEQAVGAATIVINTLAGIAKLKVKPGFPAAIPLAIAYGVQGALGVASAIMAAKKGIEAIDQSDKSSEGASSANKPTGSKFAKGGLLVGPRHSEGGIKSPYGELEGGEFVINRKSTQSFMPLLSAINSVGNRKYAEGGLTPSMDDLQQMMSSQPQPVIKTYVVANDVSSAMEAEHKIAQMARL